MAAVLLHEGAHLFAMCSFHAPPSLIEFSGLGCRIVLPDKERLTLSQKARISLAGPLVNLLSFLLMLWQPAHPFSLFSLAMGLLHILPIEPLDGGLALRALLEERMGPEEGGKTSFVLSLLFLIPLAVLGFWIVLHSAYNFSLLALCIYLMFYLVFNRGSLEL